VDLEGEGRDGRRWGIQVKLHERPLGLGEVATFLLHADRYDQLLLVTASGLSAEAEGGGAAGGGWRRWWRGGWWRIPYGGRPSGRCAGPQAGIPAWTSRGRGATAAAGGSR